MFPVINGWFAHKDLLNKWAIERAAFCGMLAFYGGAFGVTMWAGGEGDGGWWLGFRSLKGDRVVILLIRASYKISLKNAIF